MSEDNKVAEAPKVVKPSTREITLEKSLRDAVVTVENLQLLVQRMGMRSLSAEEWLKEARELLNGK